MLAEGLNLLNCPNTSERFTMRIIIRINTEAREAHCIIFYSSCCPVSWCPICLPLCKLCNLHNKPMQKMCKVSDAHHFLGKQKLSPPAPPPPPPKKDNKHGCSTVLYHHRGKKIKQNQTAFLLFLQRIIIIVFT